MVVTGLFKSALDLAFKHLNINIELKKIIVVDYIWRRILVGSGVCNYSNF